MKRLSKILARGAVCLAAAALAAVMPLSAFAAGTAETGGADIPRFTLCRRDPTDPSVIRHFGRIVTLPARAATCTESGLTEGQACSGCGAVLVEQQVIPPTGHTWDEGRVTVEPTTEAEGVRLYTCTVCGETMTEAIPKLTAESVAAQKRGLQPLEARLPDGSEGEASMTMEGSSLVVTCAQDSVIFTGSPEALTGFDRAVLVTPQKRSSFPVSKLAALSSDGDTFSLTQSGTTASLTLSGWDISYLLGE